MLINIPGQKFSLRFFEPVQTVDTQYKIVDVGIQHDNGGIDSVADGFSAHTATSAWNKAAAKDAKKKAKRDKKAASKASVESPDPIVDTTDSVSTESESTND